MKMAQDKEELIGKLKEEIDLLNRVSKYFLTWLFKEGIKVSAFSVVFFRHLHPLGKVRRELIEGFFVFV